MPLLRAMAGSVIVVVGGLLVLSELGVNITPLIAGASVFGLAVSFGSQSLVRDVVSGIFFLAEDAFRIGEYVDCSKVKGTVEGFSVRCCCCVTRTASFTSCRSARSAISPISAATGRW